MKIRSEKKTQTDFRLLPCCKDLHIPNPSPQVHSLSSQRKPFKKVFSLCKSSWPKFAHKRSISRTLLWKIGGCWCKPGAPKVQQIPWINLDSTLLTPAYTYNYFEYYDNIIELYKYIHIYIYIIYIYIYNSAIQVKVTLWTTFLTSCQGLQDPAFQRQRCLCTH